MALEIPFQGHKLPVHLEITPMRIDKFTTKFQEALGEAQSLALGNDHAYIEPAHLLVALLRQEVEDAEAQSG